MKFARLFNFSTGQLLLLIASESTTDGYVLQLETYHSEVFIQSGIAFSTFSDASDAMDAMTEDKAEQLYKALIDIVAPEIPTPKSPTLSISTQSPKGGTIEGLEEWINNSQN